MRFEIKGKEHELKLTYGAIAEINKKYKGGANEVVSLALLGDLPIFEDAIYFGLLHTEQGFTKKDIQEALEEAFEKGLISQEYIKSVLKEVITDHFFFKKTAEDMRAEMKAKMLKENPDGEEMFTKMFN